MRRLPFTTWRQLHPAPVVPWELCREPWRWSENDPMTCEVETLEFLKALVVLLKPKVIVETGTYLGESAGMLALGCRDNGFGHIWSYDTDKKVLEEAAKFLEIEELSAWVTLQHEDASRALWDAAKPIDFLFVDGGQDREAELTNFAPYLSPRAIVSMHNAHDPHNLFHLGSLDGWNKVLIPCPCGFYLLTRII